MKRIGILLLCGLLIFTVAMCGCTTATETTTQPQTNANTNTNTQIQNQIKPQVLTLGAQNDFKDSFESKSLVFDTLMKYNDDFSPKPNIIESWEVSKDKKTYILHIRKGVYFTNGKEANADVVKFSLEYWAPYRYCRYIKYLDSIEKIDNYTLKLKFKEPYAPLLEELPRIYLTLPETVDDKGNIIKWIGTGPFILKEYQKGQKAVLVRNDNYWNKEKIPKIEKVIWKVIPDENARIMALKSGAVDAIGVTEHYLSVPAQRIPELQKTPGLKVMIADKGTIETYCFNYKKGPLTDKRVRQAIAYAIDREGISKNLFNGIPQPTGHLLLPEFKNGPKNVKPYYYNPEKAKQLLAEAGYKDTNGDGILEDKDGKPLRLTLITGNTQMERDTAVYIQKNLRDIGIDLNIVCLEKKARKERAKKGDWDICRTHPWVAPPVRYLKWRCMDDGYDSFGIKFGVNDRVKELINIIYTGSDEEIKNAWNELWKIEYDFCPATGLYVRPRVFVFKDNIKGFRFDPDVGCIDLSNVTIE
ncbi:ABC transporter substrate-binding protein [Methanotorris igneus]|uniref:ABC-type transporter, periplasmic subunit n=1 Tax=Methanotorris igneus (strain DSM 5666 / JCM 11834 / Kol 5) TaxID=880724 RepID=F6BF78_METIK|nr:ABC transporter substrate-binding protein [Methanotorris igneus]AEF96948.1 ABC-type transporter, periplasmic subunit [Methanotorris igneus Kol 5]